MAGLLAASAIVPLAGRGPFSPPSNAGTAIELTSGLTGIMTPPAPDLADFLDRWCLDCHADDEPEGDLDFTDLVAGLAGDARSAPSDDVADARMLRQLRRRLVDGSMPPTRRRPEDVAYRAAITETDRVLDEIRPRLAAASRDVGDLAIRAAAAGVRSAPVRRLTRNEYAAAMRDLFGVDFDPALLPADEIGNGFDTNGDTLAMPPLRFEQYVDAAERVGRDAVVDVAVQRRRTKVLADDLERQGNGRHGTDAIVLYSTGAAVARFDVRAAGRYRVVAAVAGDQAGPELVRMQLLARDQGMLLEQEIEGQWEPTRMEATLDLEEGTFVIGAAFVNDYYDADAEDPAQRDRNAAVSWIELDGPLAPPDPTPLQRSLAARFGDRGPAEDRWRAAVTHLAERAWRRPLAADDRRRLLDAVDAAARAESAEEAETGAADAMDVVDAGGIDARRLRIGITAMLAHPRFLFRVEADPDDTSVRALDDHELAARLAQLLWSSVPDAELATAARDGVLSSPLDRRTMVDRMLDDPRSLALSEHFAAQWLRIRALADRRPDADQFPEVDAALRESMRMETILFFESMVRERRTVSELVTARETFLDETLARHYGIPGVRGPHMRRVSLAGLPGADGAGPAGLGVLRHASVLLTTSNPTRTSPVKRGKWVLEALLDDPPPPAPAFVPALPRDGAPTERESLRDLLEQHRADPSCAACHRRMDPLGFALEPFDAVGRPRTSADGVPVDAAAELPDGTQFDGPAGLRDLLTGARQHDLVRSLLRHLAVYALGRGLDPADDVWIESALIALGDDPTIVDVLMVVIESPPFLYRFAPSSGDDA